MEIENTNQTQVATNSDTQTQQVTTPTEENTQNTTATPVQPSDNSDTTQPAQEQTKQEVTPPTQEEYDKLKTKLQEYELGDAEVNQLKQRLGVDEVDYTKSQIVQTLDMIDNQAYQEYIKLCNKYGVDYRAEHIEASANKLEETNPRAYWELRANLDKLQNVVNTKKAQVQQYAVAKEVDGFYKEYQPILTSSPAINSVVQEYISTNQPQFLTRENLETLMDRTKQIYTEAYIAGMNFANQKNSTPDPKDMLNGSIMSTSNPAYPMNTEHIFTRAEIGKMSTSEFKKNEKAIMAQLAKGLI